MGIKSSVGIALKAKVWIDLVHNNPEVVEFLDKSCAQRLEHHEGVLFHLTYVKWAEDNILYVALADVDEDDYLICEACHDYPSLESACNTGCWDSNPWQLTTTIEVCISFQEIE